MTPSKAVYLMVLFLAATVFCVKAKVTRNLAENTTNGHKCGPLREGVYLGEGYFPSEIDGTELVPQVRGLFNIQRDGIGYHGVGAGVTYNSLIEDFLPRNIPVSNSLWAVFDQETCTLSGALYNFETRLIDAFKLNYDGRVISGFFAVRVNETVPFRVMAFETLTPTFD